MIRPGMKKFRPFKVGDRIIGIDPLGVVNGQPGIVREVHTSYPTEEDYKELRNPGIVYDVQFIKGNFLLKDYNLDLLDNETTRYDADLLHIAEMKNEPDFVEPWIE